VAVPASTPGWFVRRLLDLAAVATALGGCAAWDTTLPAEFLARAPVRVSVGPRIPLDPGELQGVAEPVIDRDGAAHLLVVRGGVPYARLLLLMRAGEGTRIGDRRQPEIFHVRVGTGGVELQEPVPVPDPAGRRVDELHAAFDAKDRLHLVFTWRESGESSSDPSRPDRADSADRTGFVHLIRDPGGWTRSPPARCDWLVRVGPDLVCAARQARDGTAGIAFSFADGDGFRPGAVATDPVCPAFAAEVVVPGADGSLLVSYLCGATAGDPVTWRRRIALIQEERFADDSRIASPDISDRSAELRRIVLTGMPLAVVPVRALRHPSTGLVLLVGDCASQEFVAGHLASVRHYCSVDATAGPAYRLIDTGAALFAGPAGRFGQLAWVRSPDGLNGELHYLEYRDGRWSAPFVVGRDGGFATGVFPIAAGAGHALAVTRGPATVAQWVRPEE